MKAIEFINVAEEKQSKYNTKIEAVSASISSEHGRKMGHEMVEYINENYPLDSHDLSNFSNILEYYDFIEENIS